MDGLQSQKQLPKFVPVLFEFARLSRRLSYKPNPITAPRHYSPTFAKASSLRSRCYFGGVGTVGRPFTIHYSRLTLRPTRPIRAHPRNPRLRSVVVLHIAHSRFPAALADGPSDSPCVSECG